MWGLLGKVVAPKDEKGRIILSDSALCVLLFLFKRNKTFITVLSRAPANNTADPNPNLTSLQDTDQENPVTLVTGHPRTIPVCNDVEATPCCVTL